MPSSQRYRVEADQEARDRQTASLAALAAVLLLIAASLSLVQVLRREARIETCLLSGRTDCDDLVAISPASLLSAD